LKQICAIQKVLNIRFWQENNYLEVQNIMQDALGNKQQT
jgi:hypothetical protein